MGFKVSKFIHIFLIFLLTSQYLYAHICIDVDEFNFKSESKKGLRVSVFDTNEQRYDYIDYYTYPAATKTRKPKTEIEFNYYKLKIFYDGAIEVPKEFALSNYIIRTIGTIKYQIKQDKKWKTVENNDHLLLPKGIKIQAGKEILESLNKFNSGAQGSSFKVYFYNKKGEETQKSFSSLSSNKKENDDERGIIGELATELTMISFGYNKLPSQNNSNQGFDGVFTDDSDNLELFLTESKCWKKSMSAKNILETYLSEQEVHEKIKKMSEEHKETEKTIENFIKKKPQNIYLFAHRIKPSGKSQCFVQKFNVEVYSNNLLHTLSPTSPEKEKEIVLKRLRKQIFTSDKDFLSACFKLVSKEEGFDFALDILGADEKKKKEILKLIKPKAQKKLDF